MEWVPGGRRRVVCTAASWRLKSNLAATIRCRARIRSLRTTRVGRTTRVVPTSARGGPLSAGSLIWSTPVPTRATTVRDPTGPAPARGKGSRCASSTGRLTRPLTRGRTTMGGGTPPSGAGSVGDGAGPGRGPDVVGLRPRADQERAGRLGPSPSPPDRHKRPLQDPRWGLVKWLNTAFGLCASEKPRTPDPLTWTSGIGTASGMLLWLLRGWPA